MGYLRNDVCVCEREKENLHVDDKKCCSFPLFSFHGLSGADGPPQMIASLLVQPQSTAWVGLDWATSRVSRLNFIIIKFYLPLILSFKAIYA